MKIYRYLRQTSMRIIPSARALSRRRFQRAPKRPSPSLSPARTDDDALTRLDSPYPSVRSSEMQLSQVSDLLDATSIADVLEAASAPDVFAVADTERMVVSRAREDALQRFDSPYPYVSQTMQTTPLALTELDTSSIGSTEHIYAVPSDDLDEELDVWLDEKRTLSRVETRVCAPLSKRARVSLESDVSYESWRGCFR